MNLVKHKLQLENGMKLLDVGCGFGGLSHYLIQNYDIQIKSICVN
jgi:cyclopropane-fatty-acyl-phospholipid synthase